MTLESFINAVLLQYRCRIIRQKMRTVKSYTQWTHYAKLLDTLEGLNEWKSTKESNLYDWKRIEARLAMMKHLRIQKNVKTLAHCLRQDLQKNIGRISNPKLYGQTHFGTKRIIERYHNEVIRCIRLIYECPSSQMSLQQKLTFFGETKQSFGNSAIMLSGGASFGRYHFGFLKALHEQDLMPRIICGSSAGALVAGLVCSRPYEQFTAVSLILAFLLTI